ncbi:hypothetical protein BD626DRAFT_495703 [Schizophyllum amplum]|uniref:Uncharacterized protein n=1 Tax=Schizophyllum amplum TaxID=97359 RepID=A0A550CEC7_9AGAR|nr:hypothetical protein BD626DRAFT_495703 [Auriculariopsis ampla]
MATAYAIPISPFAAGANMDSFESINSLEAGQGMILASKMGFELVRSAWLGTLLPVTWSQYRTRVQVPPAVAEQHNDLVTQVLQAYNRVTHVYLLYLLTMLTRIRTPVADSSDLRGLKDDILPGIVDIVREIAYYAGNAGSDDSPLAVILELNKSATGKPQAEKDALAGMVDSKISNQLSIISSLQMQMQNMVDALQNMRAQIDVDFQILSACCNAVRSRLGMGGANKAALQAMEAHLVSLQATNPKANMEIMYGMVDKEVRRANGFIANIIKNKALVRSKALAESANKLKQALDVPNMQETDIVLSMV